MGLRVRVDGESAILSSSSGNLPDELMIEDRENEQYLKESGAWGATQCVLRAERLDPMRVRLRGVLARAIPPGAKVAIYTSPAAGGFYFDSVEWPTMGPAVVPPVTNTEPRGSPQPAVENVEPVKAAPTHTAQPAPEAAGASPPPDAAGPATTPNPPKRGGVLVPLSIVALAIFLAALLVTLTAIFRPSAFAQLGICDRP
jgi:hypothetical protein